MKGAYLGADLMSPFKSETINLMLFQLAAKAHEITIVASLGVIVLHYVRHELLFGEGLPLGLLGSGLAFNHVEYFFSKEFCGSLRYVAAGSQARKIALIALILVAGAVATLAGPASATLLVPKSQDWTAGGTHFYLSGTDEQFWPDDLSGDISELDSTFQTQGVRSYAKELSGSKFYWPVSTTTVILQKLAEDWWNALQEQKGLTDNQVDDRTTLATFKNAIAVVQCGEPQQLRASDTVLKFPAIHGRFDFADGLPLQLPTDFGAASVGGLFESPRSSRWTDEPSRAVIGCTVQAGWVPATVYTDKYTFWKGWYPWNILFGDRTPAYNPASTERTNGRVAFGDDWLDLLTPPAPTTALEDSSWYPSTIESIFHTAGVATSPESWLSRDKAAWERVSLVEAIICSVIVDCLSRSGSHRVFNTTGPLSDCSLILENRPAMQPPSTSPDGYIMLNAEMKISGFSMQSSLATYLAMSVLLIHMLMATAHTAYNIVQRHTSGSWSTVGELIALSQNSRLAFSVLPNTGGGIHCLKTYAKAAKIRVVRCPDSSVDDNNDERIELLFDHSSIPDSALRDGKLTVKQPGNELRRLRRSRLFHPATWPRLLVHTEQVGSISEDNWPLPSSTERLVPDSNFGTGLAERAVATRVQFDSRYS
ncbi:hypothetical protein BDW67DRAFT_175314 [Aspergillus spinulosporus]